MIIKLGNETLSCPHCELYNWIKISDLPFTYICESCVTEMRIHEGMAELMGIEEIEKIQEAEFYTVTANFDMSQNGELQVKNFLDLKNAVAFAEGQKAHFLKEIPDSLLDEEWTEETSEDYHFYFYGVSSDGENNVTIKVFNGSFEDQD